MHPLLIAVFLVVRAFCFLLRRETWSSGYDGKKKENAKITTPGMWFPLVHACIIWTANFRTHHSHIAVFLCTPTLFPVSFFNASISLTQRGTQTQAHKTFKLSILVCSILFVCMCIFMVPLPFIHLLLRVCSLGVERRNYTIFGKASKRAERLSVIPVKHIQARTP